MMTPAFAVAGSARSRCGGPASSRADACRLPETADRLRSRACPGEGRGARQIVEQDIEVDVEQVAPTPDQMVEQRLLVFEQPIVTAVELVDLRQSDILTQQVGHGAALEPLAMQVPLAARREQSVGRQQQQHLVPACPLAAGAEPLGPEPVERQFAPQVHRQPAPAPLPRPAQPQLAKASAGRLKRPAASPRSGLPGTATRCVAPVFLPPERRSTCAKPVPANR
jgi:hypothetical protein